MKTYEMGDQVQAVTPIITQESGEEPIGARGLIDWIYHGYKGVRLDYYDVRFESGRLADKIYPRMFKSVSPLILLAECAE